ECARNRLSTHLTPPLVRRCPGRTSKVYPAGTRMAHVRLLSLAIALHIGVALAQPWPAKPLKLVTPFPPGGSADVTARLIGYPFVISVRPDSPFRTLGELIAYAKANPGKLNFPSSGIGTVHHLSGELLNAMAGIEMVHVPFRGGASPLTEVLGGRVDLLLEAI